MEVDPAVSSDTASANVRTIEVERYVYAPESMSEFESTDVIEIHPAYISCNNASFRIKIGEIDRPQSRLCFDIPNTKIYAPRDSIKIRKQI